MNTHYFYALYLPNEVKEQLKIHCAYLKRNLLFRRWVHHQDYHITLAFLGHADRENLLLSKELVEKAVSNGKPFPLTIEKLGVFGKQDSPRILWAGVAQENKLLQVRNLVYNGCTKAGFKLEARFNPHITLARRWAGEHSCTKDLLAANDPFLHNPISFTANRIVLYQTHLDREPKYEVIESFSLR